MVISVNVTIQNVTLVPSLPVFFQEESKVSHVKQENMSGAKQTRIKAQELHSWSLFPNLSVVSVEVM